MRRLMWKQQPRTTAAHGNTCTKVCRLFRTHSFYAAFILAVLINISMSFPYNTKKKTVLYAFINWFKVPQVTQLLKHVKM